MLSSNRALHSHNTQDGHTSLLSNQEMVVSALLCLLLYGSQTVKLNSSSTLICLYSLYILRSLQIATNLQLSHTLSLCVICHFTDRRWFCRWKQINYLWDMDIQFKEFFWFIFHIAKDLCIQLIFVLVYLKIFIMFPNHMSGFQELRRAQIHSVPNRIMLKLSRINKPA